MRFNALTVVALVQLLPMGLRFGLWAVAPQIAAEGKLTEATAA